MRHTLLFAAAALALAACSMAPEPAATADTAAPAPAAEHGFGPEISAEDFAAHVKVLSSDEFGGRAPGTEGEQKTADYLVAQFQRLGLQPGNGDSWFQEVPMVVTTADEATSTAAITVGGTETPLAFGDQMALGTRTAQQEVFVKGSEMVFVGYGVNAPEAGWNDYAGLDVAGKTVVILVNDPGFHAGDEALFSGKKMTYYGRWTYKFEEAARQGASAALIIHDDAGAGYGWDVVKNSWSGAQFDLPASADPEPRLPLPASTSTPCAPRPTSPASRPWRWAAPPSPPSSTRASARPARATSWPSCPAPSARTKPSSTPRTGTTWATTAPPTAATRSRPAPRAKTTSTTAPSTTPPAWPACSRSPKPSPCRTRSRRAAWCSCW
jgi:hypothetical protein